MPTLVSGYESCAMTCWAARTSGPACAEDNTPELTRSFTSVMKRWRPFNQNSSFTENVSATGVLGTTVPLSGTLALNWTGNSSTQARNATGSLTLSGDITSVPEPSTALLLAIPIVGLVLRRRVNSTST